jgi:alpha-N-arabinofuranosidase
MNRLSPAPFALLLLAVLAGSVVAQTPSLTIQADQPLGKLTPMHYGLMTEEISHSYDGGLYAELVRNRAFLDDPQRPASWSLVQAGSSTASIELDRNQPLNASLPVSLRLNVTSASRSVPAGVANAGYWGIPVKPRTRYRASFYAKAALGFSGPLRLAIQSEDGGTTYAQASVSRLTGEWQEYTATLKTGDVAPTEKARYALMLDRPGTVWLSLVSLFPPTWKDRPNGLRRDVMQMLVDLQPGFLRFPGGNYLEGDTIATRFEWKKTLGPLAERPGHQGPWGYRSTDGMGLMEFLLWAEDMGADPVLGVYAGYSLRGAYVKPGPDLQPYVEDALDEIEYVTGPATSTWGARRAKDGHPAPFPLRYVEVGNEDFFDRSGSYDGRFAQFYDAIKARYPELKVISTVGNEQLANRRVHSRRPDVLDEHYYRSAETFLKMAPTHYEGYDRKGPEIFVGEWGAYEDIEPWNPRSRGLAPTPSMKAALGDAAWMTGMERNADLVTMQCYAPLLVNVNPGARQWRPNLIGYDALNVYGSPSYYAIRLFSRNHGDQVMKASLTGSPLHYSVTRDGKSGDLTIKLVNAQESAQTVRIDVRGIRGMDSTATETTLGAAPAETNSMEEPSRVVPLTRKVRGVRPTFSHTVSPYSISVLHLDTR